MKEAVAEVVNRDERGKNTKDLTKRKQNESGIRAKRDFTHTFYLKASIFPSRTYFLRLYIDMGGE